MSHCLSEKVRGGFDVSPLRTSSCRLNYAVFRLANCSFSLTVNLYFLEPLIYFIFIYCLVLFLEVNKTSLFGIALVSLSHLVTRSRIRGVTTPVPPSTLIVKYRLVCVIVYKINIQVLYQPMLICVIHLCFCQHLKLLN